MTTLLDHSNTLFIAAALFKGFLGTVVLTFDFLGAETALACVLVVLGLIASHTKVVWFASTLNAEVLFTLVASYSVVGHVLGRLSGNDFVLLVLRLVVGFGRLEIEDSLAVTAHKFIIKINSLVHLHLVNRIHFLLGQIFFNIVVGDNFVA